MPSKPKGSRREYLILELHKSGQSHSEIANHFKILKSSVTTILHRKSRQSEGSDLSTKRSGHPFKLDVRAQQAIVRHLEKFLNDNQNALSTLFKSNYIIGRSMI